MSRGTLPLAVATAVAVAALLSPSAALGAQRLAVLTPSAPWSSACADPARRQDERLQERCALLETVADEVRAGALAAFDPRAVDVMTRENLAQILATNGARCLEGECEVETARIVGADFVVSGTVTVVEGTWIATLKVHAVGAAKLLATSAPIDGTSQVAVIKAVRPAAEQMLRGSLELAPPPPRTTSRRSGWVLGVEGAWVSLLKSPGPSTGLALAARAAHRVSPRLALELGAQGRSVQYDRKGELGLAGYGTVDNAIFWAWGGAEWSLVGERVVALAGGVGAGLAQTHISYDPAGPGSGSSMPGSDHRGSTFAPAANAELRLALPLGPVELGAAGGLTAVYVDSVPGPVAAGTTSGATTQLEAKKGLLLEPHVTAFVRFAL